MNFKAIVKKEVLDGIRNYRFLILVISMLFFAVLNPVMNKLFLPEILQRQFPQITDEVLRAMLHNTQVANIRAYLKDVFQVGMIAIVFALSGVLAQEISEKTLILPLTTGKRYGELLLAKMLVYGNVLILGVIFSGLVAYFYAGILFGFDLPSALPVVRAGLLQGLYLVYVLALLLLVGSLIKKPIGTGLLTLVLAYGTRYIGDLFNVNRYLPSGLLVEGEMLAVIPSHTLIEPVIYTLALLVLLFGFTIIRLSKIELTRG